MPYSLVTQPLPLLRKNCGTVSSMVAVQMTRVLPSSIRHEPSAVEMKSGHDVDRPHLLRRAIIGAKNHRAIVLASVVSFSHVVYVGNSDALADERTSEMKMHAI